MAIAGPLLLVATIFLRQQLAFGRGPLLAGLCMAAYQVCYFSAVPLAGVAATALLAICSAPIMVAVLAHLFLGEGLTKKRLLALLIGIAGAALLLAGGSGQPGANFGWGAILALGAGFSYSLYAVVSKHSLSGCEPLALSGMTFGVAAAVLAPLLGLYPASAGSLITRGGLQLLYLGAIATALAYWLYTTGLRSIPAGAAVIAGLLEPLGAACLGMLLFHEQLGASGIAGGVLLVGAVLLLGLRRRDVQQPLPHVA